MKKYPSCALGVQKEINISQLSKREQSIMEMYKKLTYSQSTQYYEVQQMGYTQLPSSFPNNIKGIYPKGVFLERFTFFQMFTMLICQYLYADTLDYNEVIDRAKLQIKNQKKNQLKSLVYSDWFMQGNYYMKGLIIKGFKLLEQSQRQHIAKPKGLVLLTSDIILAFTECWKELVERICTQNQLPKMTECQIDSSVFQIFASYFKIDFDVHWKQRGKKFWKEHFSYEGAPNKNTTLAVIVNPDNQISISQRSIPVTQSRVSCSKSIKSSSQIFSWNYVLLIKNVHEQKQQQIKKQIIEHQQLKKSQKKSKLIMQLEIDTEINADDKQVGKFHNNQISRISEVEYSCGETQQIKILLQQNNAEIENTQKKTPKYRSRYLKHSEQQQITFQALKDRQNQNCNTDLNNIWRVIDRTNSLIDQMRKYSQFLQQSQV